VPFGGENRYFLKPLTPRPPKPPKFAPFCSGQNFRSISRLTLGSSGVTKGGGRGEQSPPGAAGEGAQNRGRKIVLSTRPQKCV